MLKARVSHHGRCKVYGVSGRYKTLKVGVVVYEHDCHERHGEQPIMSCEAAGLCSIECFAVQSDAAETFTSWSHDQATLG